MKRRSVALVIGLVFLLSVFFSYQDILAEAHHHCTGENCPICLELQELTQFLSGVSILGTGLAALTVLMPYAAYKMWCPEEFHWSDTLITLKVELLD